MEPQRKALLGWWRPREVSGPTRLSHSRGSCHSAAKVSASRTDWITRPRGEGLGSDVDWRLKVFCPAFLQKSGRGPGAEPWPRAAARGISRRAAHHAPHQNKARPDETQGRRPRTADTRAGTAPLTGAARRTERAPHRRTPDKNKAARAELRGGGASFDKPVGGTRPATFLMIRWRPAYSSGYQSPAYISLTYSTHACSTSSAVIVQPSGMHP